jgi:peptidyl-prolyl cis-trans isomerase D
MFEFVRANTRLLQFLLVLLIFPSFVFFGIQGYMGMTQGGNETVAKVDGHAIKRSEWEAAHQRQVEQMRRQAPNADLKLFDTPEMKRETLDALVRERVLLAAAQDLHLAVSDDRLRRIFATDPQFAMLRNPDGSINRDILGAQGLSAEAFAQQLRTELGMRQVLNGVAETALAPAAAASAALQPLLQQREVRVQRFDPQAYATRVSPSDADIETYYKDPAHQAALKLPEQATIDYVVLDLEALKAGITVPEDELRKYYEQNVSRYTEAEERRARHILVKADKDAPAAERQKAKAKAEALLAEVRAKPASFADVARKNSDDPGSKEQGGELGFFGRDAMAKPFADAAFSMKPGEISNLVETDFGYHIIQLEEARGGERKPFEAVRAGIEDEVRKQLAQRRYAEVAEQFTNTVYEQSDSLQPVIDKLKLQKQTATVLRNPQSGAKGPLASAKFLDAVFGNDALHNKRNTDAIEVGPNQMAAAHVASYTPARVPPLAEVKDQVRQKVVQQQAAALARKDGEALLAKLKAGDAAAAEGLGAPVSVSRAGAADLPPLVTDAVLRADAAKLPADVGVDLGAQGYAVARVVKVSPPPADQLQALQPRYAQAWAGAEAQAYLAALKSRYKAEIKAPATAAAPEADAAASAAAR